MNIDISQHQQYESITVEKKDRFTEQEIKQEPSYCCIKEYTSTSSVDIISGQNARKIFQANGPIRQVSVAVLTYEKWTSHRTKSEVTETVTTYPSKPKVY